jgi:hypothetical protein
MSLFGIEATGFKRVESKTFAHGLFTPAIKSRKIMPATILVVNPHFLKPVVTYMCSLRHLFQNNAPHNPLIFDTVYWGYLVQVYGSRRQLIDIGRRLY